MVILYKADMTTKVYPRQHSEIQHGRYLLMISLLFDLNRRKIKRLSLELFSLVPFSDGKVWFSHLNLYSFWEKLTFWYILRNTSTSSSNKFTWAVNDIKPLFSDHNDHRLNKITWIFAFLLENGNMQMRFIFDVENQRNLTDSRESL